jgi:hypothetical protein
MMRSFRRTVLETGIAGGLLFGVHASLPYVYSWPLIWPPLAGAAACWLATREPGPHRLRSGLAAALASGVLLGVIAFVVIATVVHVILNTDMVPSLRPSGAPRGLTAMVGTSVAASLGAIAVVLAFVGGVLMLPVRYFQARRAHV